MEKREVYQYQMTDKDTERWRNFQIGIDLSDIEYLLGIFDDSFSVGSWSSDAL